MARVMSYLFVLAAALACLGPGINAQEGITATQNNVQYTNNSVVTITDIGTDSAALICTTSGTGCCTSGRGDEWYFPNGSAVQRSGTTYFRSRTVTNGPGGTVRLNRNPGATTTGVFRCEILDASGDLQSLYVGIYTATTGSPIVTNLRYDNQSRNLTCTSTGGPATTVTWRRDGAVITLSATYQQTKTVVDPVEGTYQTVLTIDPSLSQCDIVGIYNCTVENVRGGSSMMVVVGTVIPTVDIIITHGGGPFIAGQSYNLTCTVTLENTTRTPTVGWLDPNNNPLSSSSNITVGDTVAVNCSTYTTTLQFTTLHTFHGGQYSCQGTLGAVNNTAAVNITVLIPSPNVTVTIDQNSSTVSGGTNLTLTCVIELLPEVDTNITLNINWTGPVGDPLPGSSTSRLMAGMPTRYQSILTVNAVNASQFGNYSCTATLNSDPPTSFVTASEGSATLTIIELLHNVTIVSSGEPMSGETYNLTCAVDANVRPTVQWLYSSNGTAVTSGSGITVGTQRTTDSTTTLTLSFNPLHTSHGRQYTCRSTIETPSSTVNATRNVTVQGTGEGVRFSLRGTTYQNNSNVTLEDIGEGVDALLCLTDLIACCQMGGVRGDWFFPNRARVPTDTVNNTLQWDIYSTRGQMVVRLNRWRGGATGIYSCEIPDAMNVTQTIYIGVYTASTGAGEGVRFSLNGTTYQNNSNVTLEDIGENDDALFCLTDATACCQPPHTGEMGGVRGDWFFPNRTRVPSDTVNTTLQWDIYRTRGQMVVRLNRRKGGATGIYSCQIPDAMNVNQTIYIGVYTASTELLHNINITSSGVPTAGETYNLTCTVESNVPPTVQWLYSSNATAVTNGSDITMVTQRTNGSTTTLTLSFNPLHTSRGGQYTCQSTIETPPSAVNGTRNVTVQVATPSVTITQDPTGTPYVGGNVTLKCLIQLNNTVDSSVTVAVVWSTSDGVAITNTSRYVVSPVTDSFPSYNATLHLSNLMMNDSGNYTCNATASPDPPSPFIVSSGRQSGMLNITVVPPPSAPAITTAVSQSPTSINLTWTQPEGEVVDNYEVSFSYQGPCSGFNHTNTTTVNGTTRQYTLTGLQEFSNYTVTVVAVNGGGRSEGSSVNVVTLADAPNDPPTNVTAMATNPVSILIRWGHLLCINRNSNITGYTVHYTTGGDSTVSVSVSGTGHRQRTYIATPLLPNTSYSIQVAAVTSTGVTGPFSTNITETTSPPRSVVVLNGAIIPNHGFVPLDNIGEASNSLLCLTNNTLCCKHAQSGGVNPLGDWYYPNGTGVANNGEMWEFYRNRDASVVRLRRRSGGEDGIYRCVIPDAAGANQTIYIGVYNASTGDVVVSSIQFQLTSELNATTPAFTLTCTSTGGPATTVSWRRDDEILTDNITSQVLIDATTATYTHTLTVTGRLVGEYECNVSNNKPSSSSGMLAVVAADSPTGLTAEQLPQEPGSFIVSWTPPASSANLTGYRIYYSGADDSGSMDVGVSPTNITIDNRMVGVTYTITTVALSPHLPSPVVGPVNVTLPALPVPEVAINSTGNTTAGEMYTLSCTATVVENLVVVPNIQWEYSNGSVVEGGSNFSLSDMVTSGNTTTLNLTFNPLQTSHGEEYTCRAIINVPSISVSGLNNSESSKVTVQVPPPYVSVTLSSSAYAGTNFTLTCTIELNTAVDTEVVVNRTWHVPVVIPTGTRIVASEPTGTGARYQTILMFHPLNTSDSGNYTCEATVSPPLDSQFINASTAGRDTLSITVQVLPRPEVVITPDGSTTAGDVYTLTCSARVVENLAVEPDIQWLYTNGTTVGGGNITVGAVRMTGNMFTRNLTFNPLHTSHGGKYICNTSINVSAISLIGISNESSLDVTVQIPVNATIRRMSPTQNLSTGINFTLICTIRVDPAVDTSVVVNTSWTGPTAMFASNSQGRISVTNLTRSIPLYGTSIFFSPLNITDNGTYVCQADVRPDPPSSFIVMNNDTATHTINVGGLVAPIVMVTSEGDPTAGNAYTLVCHVIVIEGLVVDPTVVWLDSNRATVSGVNISVGGPSIEGNVVTHNLTFSPLHTSHGGEYTCRASISVSSISLSRNNLTRIIVQIPQPTVNVTSNRSGVFYAGTPLTLTCYIQLNPAVNTTVMVTRMWSGPGSQAVSNSSRVTVSNLLNRSAFIYETTIEFVSLNITDGGSYECEATVTPDPQSQFIMSTAGNDTHSVTVQALQAPMIDIHSSGASTAGQAYTLNCTATVVENLVVKPTLEWLASDRHVVNDNHISVGSSVTTGTSTSLTLAFNPLHTSHGGKYICRASINISAISLLNSNVSDSDVVVQIPSPTVNVTTMQPTINGTNVTLTCTITLDSAVDTAVNASGTWLNSNNTLTTFNTNCITVSDTQGIDHFTCQTLLLFEPLGNNSRDGGHYVCEATVIPFPESMYIRNISNNGSLPLSVQALPLPIVQFTPSTFAMAGQPYSLTCTVQVVQYLAVIPDVTWLAPDGSLLQSRSGITVGQRVTIGNITTLRLAVDQLAQSHTGNYTCRACISIGEAVIEGHCRGVMADITLSVPGRVQNLGSMHISNHSVSLQWREPENTNGAILNYTVQVQRYQPVSGSRELELVAIGPEFNRNIPVAMLTRLNNGTFVINISEGLDPLVPYRVTVVAVNLAGPGEQETMNFFTREGAPNAAPGNVEVIRLNGTAMNVSWIPLNLVEARGFVQSYIITYQQASSGSRRRRQVQTQQVDGSASFAIVGGLQSGVAYEVTVSGMTTQNGPVSAPQAVPTSPPPSSSPSPSPSGNSGAIIAGVVVALVVAVIIILVVVIGYFLYNSRHKGGVSIKTKEMFELTGKSKPEKSGSIRPLMSSIRNKKDEAADEKLADAAVEESAPVPVPSTEVTERMKPLSVISFRDHVEQMHAERDRGFEIEYQSLGSDPLASHEVAKLPFNRVKNRFANIFPYDFCRVKLKEIPGEEGSDYINASIMDGYNRKGAYIASQGPMPNTISDFWRMVWEKRLPNIVILTKCMEAGRRKCEQYWGDNIGDDFETPDNKLRITTTSVLPLADFDVRIFTVKSIENPDAEPLRVTQYHFTSWPDHGVPKFATSLTAFIRRVQKGHNKDDGYPLLVHCSAGVGRTGTFILLDSMLERIKAEDTVNVYEFLYNMRTKRVLMVQTQPQYIFIHDALDELITCGETDIPAAGLRVKVNRLRKTIPGKGITGFAEQFKLLDQVSRQPEEGDFSDAQEHYNREKNRYPDKLPYNMSRARLRPTAEDGSEYINASFVDGYKHRNAYIATQAPLKTTVNDFWRMIWEFKSKSIVMLCNMMEDNQETSYPYWPTKEEETIKYGKIIVTMQSKAAYGDFGVRKFNLQEDKSQGSPTEGFQVTQFHHTEWPETGKPPAAGGLIEMIDLLMKTQMNTGNRTITVMCNGGVGRTGAFICIHSQLERLKTEGVVDIFQSIKSARIQRAGLVPQDDQYAFCHEVLADYVDKFENYANFKDMV